jgi:hypothetical protein
LELHHSQSAGLAGLEADDEAAWLLRLRQTTEMKEGRLLFFKTKNILSMPVSMLMLWNVNWLR